MEKVENITIILGLQADSNTYIFDDVIVDPGTGLNKDYLLNSIKESGINIDDLNRIVNTHCHFDHIGGDKFLQDEYGFEIYMHESDIETVKRGNPNEIASTSFNMPVPELELKPLKDGDKINNFNVIHTPGHTCGGICLYDGESLISGDTIFSGGSFGRADLPTGNKEELKESLNKLTELDVKYLFPGHEAYAINSVNEQIKMSAQIVSII